MDEIASVRTIVAFHRPCSTSRALLVLICALCLVRTFSAAGQTTGALGTSLSAAAQGRGGTTVAEQGSPLDAMEGNPAGLAGTDKPVLELAAIGSMAFGSFRNSVDPSGGLHGAAGALPYGALAMPLGESGRWVAGLAITPDSLTRVDWRYIDPPGTAGVSYGLADNESRISVIRMAAGLAAELGPRWSVGATVGLDYNTNTLRAPYIFQEQPQLAGLKVLVNLQTSGFGWNGGAGVQWQPSSSLRLGAAWKSGTYVQSHGSAKGSASALFSALGNTSDPTFDYGAEVDNHLPQAAAAGLHWEQNQRLHWAVEGNWTDWEGAFRVLPVKLKDGSNPVINTVVGSDALEDEVKLYWRGQGAIHVGLELPLSEVWRIRGGYTYMSNPVPSATLTPVTAAILRNGLAAGAGYTRGKATYSVAYEALLPATQNVGQSALLAGEYSNSQVRIMEQSLILTARWNF